MKQTHINYVVDAQGLVHIINHAHDQHQLAVDLRDN